MPVLTKTRSHTRVDEEVETKAEPEVIVDKGLAGLVKEWDQADKKAEAFFPRICQYVLDNDISREMLKKALIQIRHMKEITANNEVSKVFKSIERPELVEQALDKKITVRELREATVTKRDSTDDPETVFKKKIQSAAGFAIEEPELQYDENQFLRAAKRGYKDAYTKSEAKAARAEKAAEDGAEGEEETEGDEEE